MKFKPLFTIFFFGALVITGSAQDKSTVKFGKVTPEDFAKKVYSIDSNANAVVIADIGSSEIEGNSKNWFSINFKRYKRVHILNKNGYDEGNVEVVLYSEGSREETLVDVRAVTYNLENGKVVETKLDKAGIFKDKLDKYYTKKKFTLPNIREGSIIEYEYSVQSDFLFNLRPWAFQGESPVLWSEYKLLLPEFFSYVFLTQGYRDFDIKERKDSRVNFVVRDSRGAEATESSRFDANVANYRWVMKDVPALKEENFTSTLANHIAKIEFQLTGQSYPLLPYDYMGTWEKLAEDLLHSEYFGNTLDKNNGWLSDIVNPLVAGTNDKLEKAKRIYSYVRDNLSCTSYSAANLDQPLKTVLKTRKGTVAEINLLLVAMLKYVSVEADPVILSTRSHGYTYSVYPILTKFNYVICNAKIDGRSYFLDASEPRMGFARLASKCYNGHARIIDPAATPVEFSADSIQERKLTSLMLTSNDKGEMLGSVNEAPGYFESSRIRQKVMEKGKDDFFKDIKKNYGDEVEIINSRIDSLDILEEPVGLAYNFKLNPPKEDLVYINPMFGDGYKENPFKSAERLYPVEMPYPLDEMYLFTMIIPEGYVVDELPKSIIVKLNEQGDGQFEYRLQEANGTISMRSRLQLKRAYFLPAEYEDLREFFNLVVKKHSEQIVLKKKK